MPSSRRPTPSDMRLRPSPGGYPNPGPQGQQDNQSLPPTGERPLCPRSNNRTLEDERPLRLPTRHLPDELPLCPPLWHPKDERPLCPPLWQQPDERSLCPPIWHPSGKQTPRLSVLAGEPTPRRSVGRRRAMAAPKRHRHPKASPGGPGDQDPPPRRSQSIPRHQTRDSNRQRTGTSLE